MPNLFPQENYNLTGKTAIITGAAGVLCSEMARNLAKVGVKTAILDINLSSAQEIAQEITEIGGSALAVQVDVLDKASLIKARELIKKEYQTIDLLICGAGGNNPQATTSENLDFFALPEDALTWVFNLNFLGTVLTSQVFGEVMAKQGYGTILNISSMNAFRPLTRIPAYSAAKAAVSNFTQWLAVHMAQEYSTKIRVNAIAPGFFIGEQNRGLLLNDDDTLTPRGQNIINHTPMRRFGTKDELIGTMFYLLSSASAFVTGIVIPVDGGFSAYSGV
jgi:NAD(P)-dependent dehydrogenase (short-subunit alcohol dehydrogenase family)